MRAFLRPLEPCARVDNSTFACAIPGVTNAPDRKLPDYDPATGLNRFRWILAASQAVRDQQPERIAQEIQRINDRAQTHGRTQDPR